MVRLAAWSLAILVLVSCGAFTVPITEQLPTVTVDPSAMGLPAGSAISSLQDVTLPAQDTFGASYAAVDSFTFSLADSSQTFDFLSEIHFILKSSGQPDVEIANLAPVPTGVTSISMNVVQGVNVIGYLGAGATLSTNVVGTVPAQTVSINGQIVANVGL